MYKNNILVVLIILILLALFFVATRDYEKFKLLERNQTAELDKQTKAIVYATKFCNQFDEIYRNPCYSGIGLAIGYEEVENFSKCKPLDESIKSFCYDHMGQFLGKKYDVLSLVMQKCNEAEMTKEEKESCETRAIEELAKKYAKNITRAEEFCKIFSEKKFRKKKEYAQECYTGLGKGIAQNYFQENYESLKLCDNVPWVITCKEGYFEGIIGLQEKTSKDILKMMELSSPSPRLSKGWGYLNAKKNLENLQLAFTLCDQFSNLTYKNVCYQGVYVKLGKAKYRELVG